MGPSHRVLLCLATAVVGALSDAHMHFEQAGAATLELSLTELTVRRTAAGAAAKCAGAVRVDAGRVAAQIEAGDHAGIRALISEAGREGGDEAHAVPRPLMPEPDDAAEDEVGRAALSAPGCNLTDCHRELLTALGLALAKAGRHGDAAAAFDYAGAPAVPAFLGAYRRGDWAGAIRAVEGDLRAAAEHGAPQACVSELVVAAALAARARALAADSATGDDVENAVLRVCVPGAVHLHTLSSTASTALLTATAAALARSGDFVAWRCAAQAGRCTVPATVLAEAVIPSALQGLHTLAAVVRGAVEDVVETPQARLAALDAITSHGGLTESDRTNATHDARLRAAPAARGQAAFDASRGDSSPGVVAPVRMGSRMGSPTAGDTSPGFGGAASPLLGDASPVVRRWHRFRERCGEAAMTGVAEALRVLWGGAELRAPPARRISSAAAQCLAFQLGVPPGAKGHAWGGASRSDEPPVELGCLLARVGDVNLARVAFAATGSVGRGPVTEAEIVIAARRGHDEYLADLRLHAGAARDMLCDNAAPAVPTEAWESICRVCDAGMCAEGPAPPAAAEERLRDPRRTRNQRSAVAASTTLHGYAVGAKGLLWEGCEAAALYGSAFAKRFAGKAPPRAPQLVRRDPVPLTRKRARSTGDVMPLRRLVDTLGSVWGACHAGALPGEEAVGCTLAAYAEERPKGGNATGGHYEADVTGLPAATQPKYIGRALPKDAALRSALRWAPPDAATAVAASPYATADHLQHGRRLWVLTPPGSLWSPSPHPFIPAAPTAFAPPQQPAASVRCVQEAGDTLLLPPGWAAGYVNLWESVSFGHLYDD